MSLGSSSTTWFYTYNLNNQITSAQERATSSITSTLLSEIDYGYDVFGDMISRVVSVSGSSTTHFAYDVSNASPGINDSVNPLYAELNSSGTITERYLRDPNGNIAGRTSSDPYGVAWLMTDYQGSVRDILTAAGAWEGTVSYDGFGNITSETGAAITGNYAFQGMYLDRALTLGAGSGTNEAVYRFELPDGQWSAQDQSGLGPDVNDRREMGNDGTNAVDPSGLSWVVSRKGEKAWSEGCITVNTTGDVWYTPSRTDDAYLGKLIGPNGQPTTDKNNAVVQLGLYKVPYSKVYAEAELWGGAATLKEWQKWFIANTPDPQAAEKAIAAANALEEGTLNAGRTADAPTGYNSGKSVGQSGATDGKKAAIGIGLTVVVGVLSTYLSPAASKILGGLAPRAGEKVSAVIRSRGGKGTNVREAGHWAEKTLGEAAEAAATGDQTAAKAIKIAKDAKRLGEKY